MMGVLKKFFFENTKKQKNEKKTKKKTKKKNKTRAIVVKKQANTVQLLQILQVLKTSKY